MLMNKTPTNLSRVLSGLDVDHRADTPDQRTTVQKSVYLAQANGINLGATSTPGTPQRYTVRNLPPTTAP